MEELVKELIRLGEEYPQLRGALKPILDYLTEGVLPSHSVQETQDPVPETKVPDSEGVKKEQPLPTPESEKGQFFSLSPAAFRAFNQVLLPQIQAQLDAASFQDLGQMMDEMEGLGMSKNVALENALIVYKPISMNTRRFYQEVQQVFQNWIRPKLKGEGGEDSEKGGEGKKEYNFNFS